LFFELLISQEIEGIKLAAQNVIGFEEIKCVYTITGDSVQYG